MYSFINFFLFSVPKCQLPEAKIVLPEGRIVYQGKITLHVSFLLYNPLAEAGCCGSDLVYMFCVLQPQWLGELRYISILKHVIVSLVLAS